MSVGPICGSGRDMEKSCVYGLMGADVGKYKSGKQDLISMEDNKKKESTTIILTPQLLVGSPS